MENCFFKVWTISQDLSICCSLRLYLAQVISNYVRTVCLPSRSLESGLGSIAKQYQSTQA